MNSMMIHPGILVYHAVCTQTQLYQKNNTENCRTCSLEKLMETSFFCHTSSTFSINNFCILHQQLLKKHLLPFAKQQKPYAPSMEYLSTFTPLNNELVICFNFMPPFSLSVLCLPHEWTTAKRCKHKALHWKEISCGPAQRLLGTHCLLPSGND